MDDLNPKSADLIMFIDYDRQIMCDPCFLANRNAVIMAVNTTNDGFNLMSLRVAIKRHLVDEHR